MIDLKQSEINIRRIDARLKRLKEHLKTVDNIEILTKLKLR